MTKVQELKQQIHSLQMDILSIQEECSHPSKAVTRVAKSDTGNWSKSDDAYWYECECSLCDKRWTEGQ